MVALLNTSNVGSPAFLGRGGPTSVPTIGSRAGSGRGSSGGPRVATRAGTRATVTAGLHADREHLRLVDSPPHESLTPGVPVAGLAVAVAVVFVLLFSVRLIQGTPPATMLSGSTVESPGSAQALAGPGDRIHVAQPGDTYWGLALELSPEADPRPIVDVLVAVNGGVDLDAGQRVVIPAELLGDN